jgi:hypothetical protein
MIEQYTCVLMYVLALFMNYELFPFCFLAESHCPASILRHLQIAYYTPTHSLSF